MGCKRNGDYIYKIQSSSSYSDFTSSSAVPLITSIIKLEFPIQLLPTNITVRGRRYKNYYYTKAHASRAASSSFATTPADVRLNGYILSPGIPGYIYWPGIDAFWLREGSAASWTIIISLVSSHWMPLFFLSRAACTELWNILFSSPTSTKEEEEE